MTSSSSLWWTTFSANPLKFRAPDGRVVWACEKLSAGCTNCYAESLSHRYGGSRRAGDWNAAVMSTLTPFLDDAELHKMLTYKPASGKRVFVGDMTDLFGSWVSDALLDRLFAVFALRPDVTWQVLTKRAERMRAYIVSRSSGEGREALHDAIQMAMDAASRGWTISGAPYAWPLPNVWLGVSCENQRFADERIPLLLQTPAAIRFISAEPLLAPIDLTDLAVGDAPDSLDALEGETCSSETTCIVAEGPGLDWVIVGCESWKHRRNQEAYEAQARSILKRCADAGVAAFHKQMPVNGRVSGDLYHWPADMRVRQWPTT